uniref:Fatty acyl-CoA reductase C-terminal domain-containing protein n=1 Tax=Anopheles melas TaxID=34690 RepID=A0A182TUQ4_9DIPT
MAAKTNRFLETMAYFGLREWQIANENVVRLRTLLTPTEASLLEFDLSTVDWDEYFQAYIPGIRRYYLGELPAARDRTNPGPPLAWNRSCFDPEYRFVLSLFRIEDVAYVDRTELTRVKIDDVLSDSWLWLYVWSRLNG